MKKLFVIPLLFLYMVATSGIIVHLHYCGEQIESWAFNSETNGCEDDPCDENDTEEHHCCKDKVVKSKISWEQSVVSQFKLSLSQKFVVSQTQVYFFETNEAKFSPDPSANYSANAPPGNWQSIPLYQLHSSLTYYG
jgi:hypothetical protein